jgi:hypothetical protein
MLVNKNKSESQRMEILKNKTIYYNYVLNNSTKIQSGSDTTHQESARLSIVLGSIETPCLTIKQTVAAVTEVVNIITSDLLIHFEANDPTSYTGSGSTWVNIGTGGTTYNATLLGTGGLPTFVNGSIKSFQFTRLQLSNSTDYLASNYMRFLRPNGISDDFTWCAWINTTQVGNIGINHYNLMFIVSTETGGVNDDFGFGIDSNGKLAYGDGKSGGADITLHSNTSVNTGLWTFVAVTRKKSTGAVVLYINGVADKSGTCNIGNTLSTATYVIIASETDFPGFTFGGNLGAVLGNTSVLTADQILQNFNAQRATYGV